MTCGSPASALRVKRAVLRRTTPSASSSAARASPTDTDANPNDDFLFVGGIDLWRSTDGGANCTRVSQWWQWPASAHADQHIIVEHPNYDGLLESRIYFGNDGGIYQTTIAPLVEPLVGWTSLNHDLAITQFYDGAGVRPGLPAGAVGPDPARASAGSPAAAWGVLSMSPRGVARSPGGPTLDGLRPTAQNGT